MTTTSAQWICPECSGPWIRNFVFDHDRTTCSLGKAEDATQYADHERFGTRNILERRATHAEIALAEVIAGYSVIPMAQFHSPDMPAPVSKPVMTTVTMVAPGVLHRVVSRVNPEQIVEAS